MNVIDAIGWTLLNFLWQGLLIGGIFAALRAQFGRPQTRYLLGMAALALCALAPLLTFWWLWPAQPSGASVQRLPERMAAAPGFAGLAQGDAWHRVDLVLPWLVGSWCAGIALLGARAIGEWWRLARARRNAIRVDAWNECIASLALRFGIRRSIDLLATAAVEAPTLLGVFKPAILLPTALLLRLPPAQLELILAHELCHVRRWDYLVNLVQVALETLLFYHPVVHWISSRVRADRELCCDLDVVEMMGAPPRRYAQALAELAETASHLAPAANGGVLVERIEVLLAPPRARRAPGVAWAPLLSIAAVFLLAFGLKRTFEPAAAGLVAPTSTHASAPHASTPRVVAVQSRIPDRVFAPVALPARSGAPAEDIAPTPARRHHHGTANVGSDVARKIPAKAARRAPALRKNVAPETSEAARGAQPSMPMAGMSSASPKGNSRDVPIPRIAAPTVDPPARTLPGVAPHEPDFTAQARAAPTRPATQTVWSPETAAPRVTHFVAPVYPTALSDRAVHARVDLQFRIAADGSVQDVAVMGGADHPQLARAAMSALRQWRFASEGAEAGHVYRQSIDFDLAEGAEVCRMPTGSHICRRDLGDAAAGVTAIAH